MYRNISTVFENNEVKPLKMKWVGRSDRDDETWYGCPKCDAVYGSWDLFNKGQLNSPFTCKCGALLTVH